MKLFTLLIALVLIVAISGCGDNDDNPQPTSTSYTSAEAYLTELGFSGSLLIRKGDIYLVRKEFTI